MSSVRFKDLTTRFSVKRDLECPSVFENLKLEITHRTLGPVAKLSAVKIYRSRCRGSFLEILDAHSEDLQHFSVELFDNYGRVYPWLFGSGNRSGTGAWGKELNDGQLVFIMKMSVVEKYRGKGIGSFALKKFVEDKHIHQSYDTVLCWPTPELNIAGRDNEWKTNKDRQVAFFRKNGFRRVGRTEIFGYSPRATHPSRSIPVADDAKERGEEFDSSDRDLPIDEIRKKYPLPTAIFNVKEKMNVADTIRKHYTLDPESIHQPNFLGYTPIHAALMAINLEAVRVLLELGVTEDLHNSSNIECLTPLETLESVMLSSRQDTSWYRPQWKEYNDDVLTCEFLVRRAMGKPTMANTLADYIVKRKWGCTCGACAGGWLSKHMRSNLSMVIYQTLDTSDSFELETFPARAQHPNPHNLMLIRDFPPELHQSVVPSFYAACRAVFEAVLNFLDKTDEPLSVAAILARTSNDKSVEPFFAKGGRIEYVLDSITKWTMFRILKGDDMEFEVELEEVVLCANDLDFSLVRKRLGLEMIILLHEGNDSDDVGDGDDEDGFDHYF